MKKINSSSVVICFNSSGKKHYTFEILTAASIVACAYGLKIIVHTDDVDFADYMGADVFFDFDTAVRECENKELVFLKNSSNYAQPVFFASDFNFFIFQDEKDAEDVLCSFLQNGVENAMCIVPDIQACDGFSVCGQTKIYELKNSQIKEYTILPEKLGIQRAEISSLRGATQQYNLSLIRDVFAGKIKGSKLDSIAVNAGAMIYLTGKSRNILEGVMKAYSIVDKGFALEKLKSLNTNY